MNEGKNANKAQPVRPKLCKGLTQILVKLPKIICIEENCNEQPEPDINQEVLKCTKFYKRLGLKKFGQLLENLPKQVYEKIFMRPC